MNPAADTDAEPDDELDRWFVTHVLPLEGMLVGLIRRNWRTIDEVADLRQEVFVRVYEAARTRRPESARAFVITIARNLLIDHARRAQIVSIETFAEFDDLALSADELTPERVASGREELRSLALALAALPPRCREVVELRKVDGLSQREVADRLGIAEDTVEKQIAKGMRLLADALLARGVDMSAWIRRRKSQQGSGTA